MVLNVTFYALCPFVNFCRGFLSLLSAMFTVKKTKTFVCELVWLSPVILE
jgi:hypothetical protein